MGDGDKGREFELEVVVPGTADEVWEAVATGPGLTSWFVPAEVEPRLGGEVRFHFGTYGTDVCEVTAWQPPQRFGFAGFQRDRLVDHELAVHPAPDSAAASSACTVRLRCWGFGSDRSWVEQVEALRASWAAFLDVLALAMAQGPGRPCATTIVNGTARGEVGLVWLRLLARLGLEVDVGPGEVARLAVAGGKRWHAEVARHRDHVMVLRLEDPGPVISLLGAQSLGPGLAHVAVYTYAYAEDPEAPARQVGAAWQAWMDRWFPFDLEAFRW